MSLIERDPLSGYTTTGHDWNGIKELNAPIPKIVFIALGITFIYAVISWFLLPSWPVGNSYLPGLLGIDQRKTVASKIEDSVAERAHWEDQVRDLDYADIRSDDALMSNVLATAETLYGNNCQVCHGAGGVGGPGYPNLADDAWLWGGSADAIDYTLQVGINSSHPDTQLAQMLAFGRDGILGRDDIRNVVAYVQSLSGIEDERATPERKEAGAVIYEEQCAACHGDDGAGMVGAGFPNLTDQAWIYGGDWDSLMATIINGRQGYMPYWSDRLSATDIKMLTLYVQSLSGITE